MPSIENWLEDPLSIIKNIFDNRKSDEWQKQVHEYFKIKFSDQQKYAKIPSINCDPLHNIKPNSLVKFRGMIQETFEHEYYLDTYNVESNKDGSKTVMTSRFQDVVSPPLGCNINMQSENNKTEMRQILYCVSVPGETKWTKKGWNTKQSSAKNDIPGTSTTPKKRSLDVDFDNCDEEDMEQDADGNANKRQKAESTSNDPPKATKFNKNHPLPNEDGPVCLVKIYDDEENYKVNQVFEFVGVLSVDPSLSATYDRMAGGDTEVASAVEGQDADMFDEQITHYPPASLVPRLHVISCKKLEHLNPSLPIDMNQEVLSSFQNMAPTLRSDLISVFTKATLGDALTAEYLLAHLLARVYARRDVLAVGTYPINITGVPPDSEYPRLLGKFLSEFLTKIFCFSMTLENLNKSKFIPMKNYETDRLETGILQLSDGTHLILDESAMKPGNLDANGVKHVQALERLLTGQTVDYNFKFHHIPFHCDINVLILSEGKSLLSCDCQVPLKPVNGFPSDLKSYFSEIKASLNDEMLNRFRMYLDASRLLEHAVPDDLMETIGEDFVVARRTSSDNMKAVDLHMLLILARLLSISVGNQLLTQQTWNHVKLLEAQRKQRLPPIPSPQSSMLQPNENGHAINGH